MKNDLLKIINEYGLMKQLKYFQTEVFELNQAIIEYHYDENKSYEVVEAHLKNHIAEEIADVEVMLLQFKEYLDIPDEKIDEVMEFKIKRQLERIEEGKEKWNY